MPAPPASSTAWLLFTSTLPPRSQTTILPATLAGSSVGVLSCGSVRQSLVPKQSASLDASTPGRPASFESDQRAATERAFATTHRRWSPVAERDRA